MNPNETFFYEHAGYCYGPGQTPDEGRRECAAELAAAEHFALEAGIRFRWDTDPDTDSRDFSDEPDPWPLWVCVAYNADGNIIQSLGGIDFGRDGSPWSAPYAPYARVVEAELAAQARTESAES